MKDASKVNVFIEQLKQGSTFTRCNAAFVLGKMGEQAVPALIDALASEQVEVRKYAAYALGRIGNLKAVPALQEASRDTHRAVAKWAADALKAIGE